MIIIIFMVFLFPLIVEGVNIIMGRGIVKDTVYNQKRLEECLRGAKLERGDIVMMIRLSPLTVKKTSIQKAMSFICKYEVGYFGMVTRWSKMHKIIELKIKELQTV